MRYLPLFLMLLFFITLNGCVFADTIIKPKLVVVAEDYYPFTYSENGKVSGTLVDLVESITYTAGMPVLRNNIRIIPWDQAYVMAQQMPDVLLLGLYRMPNRENLYKWIGPVETDPSVFFIKPGSSLRIKSFSDVKKLQIAVIAGDAHYDLLKYYGIAPDHIFTSASGEDIVRMVLNGEIDTFYYGEKAGRALANKVTGSPDAMQSGFTFGESNIWFAMSKTTSNSTISVLQDALNKTSGFKRISGH